MCRATGVGSTPVRHSHTLILLTCYQYSRDVTKVMQSYDRMACIGYGCCDA